MNNLRVDEITYHDTKHWILNIHYAKRMPCISHSFGLFYENKIVGVCTFGIPASPSLCKGVCGEEYKSIVLELNRLVLHPNLPRNSASYFISRCIKKLPKPRILISYADTQMTHIGYVYQATNWIYTGATKPRTDMYAGEGKHSRHSFGDRTQRVFRSSKHRYVYFHGADLREKLNYKIQPYPKGDLSRYVIDSDALSKAVL